MPAVVTAYAASAACCRPLVPIPHATRRRVRGVQQQVCCASVDGGASQPSQVDVGPSGLENVEGNYRPTSLAGWAIMRRRLMDANVKVISQQELVFAIEKGLPIIDIRPASEFEQEHIEGSVNVPLYQPIEGWSPFKVARRVGFALFGVMNGTEVNPTFLEDVQAAIADADAGCVLVCNLGGAFETDQSRAGLQSRSMIAAYQLITRGYTNICLLRDGYYGWRNAGRAVVSTAAADDDVSE